jgi:chaperonin GroES
MSNDIPGLPRIPAHLLREYTVQPQSKTFQPLHDVVIYRIEQGRTASGIVLPENAKSGQRRIVVAVGPGVLLTDGTIRPLTVKPGDEIMPAPGAQVSGTDILGGEPHYVTREGDIAAILVPDVASAS